MITNIGLVQHEYCYKIEKSNKEEVLYELVLSKRKINLKEKWLRKVTSQ